MKNRPLLVPSYMREFSCIGASCEDTCCIGWGVDIDQKTYKKYNRLNDAELRPLLDKYVKRNRSNPSEDRYAKIKLSNRGACPLLSNEGLCKIQEKVGESYLSDVCMTYPRTTNVVNDVYEKSATMSCPEAARLALLNPDGIEFDEIEEEREVRNKISSVVSTTTPFGKQSLNSVFWELRIFTIQVLQNRQYPIADRLIILGMFFQKVDEYKASNRVSDIPVLIANFTNVIEDGSISGSLQEIPSQTTLQMLLLKELADERFYTSVGNKRYLECYATFLGGLEYNAEHSIEQLSERYQEAYSVYYRPFMDEHEYIFENYLVNFVFKNLFPIAKFDTTFDEYFFMVLHYALIKMHLIGMARHYKEQFSLELVIKMFQSFAKTVEHNKFYLNHAFDLVDKNGYKSLAHVAILIKN